MDGGELVTHDRECEMGTKLLVAAQQAYVWVRVGLVEAHLTPNQARAAAFWLIQCANAVDAHLGPDV